MPNEPAIKRAVVFVDGQNLFYAAKNAFGYAYPNFNVISLAHQNAFDVALVFSQDQDLSEVADEIRLIAGLQKRWMKIDSAFPVSPVPHNKRGINGTDWIRIDRATYDACLDIRDYRPKRKNVEVYRWYIPTFELETLLGEAKREM